MLGDGTVIARAVYSMVARSHRAHTACKKGGCAAETGDSQRPSGIYGTVIFYEQYLPRVEISANVSADARALLQLRGREIEREKKQRREGGNSKDEKKEESRHRVFFSITCHTLMRAFQSASRVRSRLLPLTVEPTFAFSSCF